MIASGLPARRVHAGRPGTFVESPGWFRIWLTASDEMVEAGLRTFRETRG
jgi:hypothetical protein